MVEIQDTLVSLDIFKEMFCCDYKVCRGACCVEGDAGAPVDMEEVAGLEEAAEAVWDELTPGSARRELGPQDLKPRRQSFFFRNPR